MVISAGAFLFGSCTPLLQDFFVDVKVPSPYNLPLQGKTIAVFSPNYQSPFGVNSFLQNDSSAISKFSIGIARGLEQSLSLREGEIPTFSIDVNSMNLQDSILADRMFRSSISDFVLLVDNLFFELPIAVKNQDPVTQDTPASSLYSVPGYFSIRVYDKYSGYLPPIKSSDSIFVEVGKKELENMNNQQVMRKMYETIAFSIGRDIASRMIPRWDTEVRKIFVYYSPEWIEAYKKASSFEWEEAIKIWTGLLTEKDKRITSAAAFNIALACELTDRLDLAVEWLDYSYNELPKKITMDYKSQIIRKIEEKH